MPRLPPAKSWSPSLSQRMLAILAASVIAVSAPAALVFYFFTRDAAIAEAEQFAATSADGGSWGLNYTLRLAEHEPLRASTSCCATALPSAGTDEEVSRFRSVLERNHGRHAGQPPERLQRADAGRRGVPSGSADARTRSTASTPAPSA